MPTFARYRLDIRYHPLTLTIIYNNDSGSTYVDFFLIIINFI